MLAADLAPAPFAEENAHSALPAGGLDDVGWRVTVQGAMVPSQDEADDAMRGLFRMTVALSRAQSVQEIYDVAMDGVRRALGADRAAILVLDNHDVMRFRASTGLSLEYRMAVEGHSPWTRKTSTPLPIIIEDVLKDPSMARFLEAFAREGIRGLGFIPLISPSGLLGKLMLYYDRPHHLTGEDVSVAQSIAGHVALMIQRGQALEALRESEARLREAQAIAHVGSFHWDARSGAVTWSDELFRIYGRDPALFWPSFDAYVACVIDEDRPRMLETLTKCMNGDGPFSHEYRVLLPDGSMRWMYARGRAVRQDGELLSLEGTCQDITERKRSEASILELEGQVRQAQKMEALGRLSGGIAHDFNNLLAVIVGNAEIASEEVGDGHAAAENLTAIRQACDRAVSLVQQILSFSRRRPTERRPLSLIPVIDEVTRFMRATLPAGIDLCRLIDPDAPEVLADATQIHQVLVNLCTNAWHAIVGGAGRIEIHLRVIVVGGDRGVSAEGLAPGRWVQVTVSDTGQGMDAPTVERMFEPFFTTKPVGKGTGLGLSMVHGIMESHEGVIRVDSQVGRGTRIHLYFPAIGVKAPASGGASPTTEEASGQRVLYVDDEESVAKLIAQVLRRVGYTPLVFLSAEEALEAIAAGVARPELIITDMNMPTLSGLQFAERVKALTPDVPIVLISGQVTDNIVVEARRLGVVEILNKPLRNQDLIDHVSRLLGSRRS